MAAKSDPTTKPNRLVSADTREDDGGENSLRPLTRADFIGQDQARANLQVFIDAARGRNEALG